MTFRIDTEIKKQMADICAQLGMTTSSAFNIFANAFVRSNGMPFPVVLQVPEKKINYLSREQIKADTDKFLAEFADDYKRMAE